MCACLRPCKNMVSEWCRIASGAEIHGTNTPQFSFNKKAEGDSLGFLGNELARLSWHIQSAIFGFCLVLPNVLFDLLD